jgi:thiamine-phosphate pyrophosphorylase
MDPDMEAAVRALEEGWRSRDFEALEGFADPDVVLDWSGSLSPTRGVYRGLGEARRLFDSMLDAFSETTWRASGLAPLGNRLAMEGRFAVRGGSSGVETAAVGGQVWTFEKGRVKMIKLFQSRAAAVRGMRSARLAEAHLYFVCEALPSGQDPGPLLDAALRGGVDVMQMREKAARSVEELVALAAPFRRAATEHGALFIVNDRPDLVAACGADGVHVGQEDMAVAEARGLVGPEALIGLSTHSPEQLEGACAATGASRPDQLSVGPVWETPTKAGRAATGLGLIEVAAREATIPWFAIGGIGVDNVAEVVAAGASRIVVVRAIRDAADPEVAARALRRALVDGAAPGGRPADATAADG